MLAVGLLAQDCDEREALSSDPQCRPATTITTGLGGYDVPLLSVDRRLSDRVAESLLSNFDLEAEHNAARYCMNHPTPCAWVYEPARRDEIERRRGFGFSVGHTSPTWRTLPPSIKGSYRVDVWAVEIGAANVACRGVVTIQVPPPSSTTPSGSSSTGGASGSGAGSEGEHEEEEEEAEPKCPNPPAPAWARAAGLYGGTRGKEVRSGDTIQGAEERLFQEARDALLAGWKAEIAAACAQANPGHSCVPGFDPNPDITYNRHPVQRSPQTGLLRAVLELRLRNDISGVCLPGAC